MFVYKAIKMSFVISVLLLISTLVSCDNTGSFYSSSGDSSDYSNTIDVTGVYFGSGLQTYTVLASELDPNDIVIKNGLLGPVVLEGNVVDAANLVPGSAYTMLFVTDESYAQDQAENLTIQFTIYVKLNNNDITDAIQYTMDNTTYVRSDTHYYYNFIIPSRVDNADVESIEYIKFYLRKRGSTTTYDNSTFYF